MCYDFHLSHLRDIEYSAEAVELADLHLKKQHLVWYYGHQSDVAENYYLVFDPDPVDEDERERREQAEQIAKWQAQTLEMQQYFEHLKVKKPLPSQWLLFML